MRKAHIFQALAWFAIALSILPKLEQLRYWITKGFDMASYSIWTPIVALAFFITYIILLITDDYETPAYLYIIAGFGIAFNIVVLVAKLLNLGWFQ